MAKKKPIRPLLVDCPQCRAKAGIKCVEQGFILEHVHLERFALARLRQTPPARDPDTPILMVRCPRCGAPPRRTCYGPPPARDPKPYHKERWLAKERVDNEIRKSRGQAPKSIGKPWLEDRAVPPNKPYGWRELQEFGEEQDD